MCEYLRAEDVGVLDKSPGDAQSESFIHSFHISNSQSSSGYSLCFGAVFFQIENFVI